MSFKTSHIASFSFYFVLYHCLMRCAASFFFSFFCQLISELIVLHWSTLADFRPRILLCCAFAYCEW